MLPVLAAAYALAIGASAFIVWFKAQPEKRQKEVNAKFEKLAWQTFQKEVSQLSRAEFDVIADRTKTG